MSDSLKVWDAPLRLFHWTLALSVGAAIVTGWLGGNLMAWHGRLGVLVFGLLVFRLLWGVFGSTYARWTRIVRAPLGLPAYLRGQWREAGHNPLGALSTLALLGLLGVQTFSGLFADDDIAFRGPLQVLAASETSVWLTGVHRQAAWLLIGLIGLHVLAIAYYSLVRRLPLLRAMLTGRGARAGAQQRDAEGGGRWSFVLSLGLRRAGGLAGRLGGRLAGAATAPCRAGGARLVRQRPTEAGRCTALFGAELIVAGLAALPDLAEGGLGGRLIAAGGDAGQLVGGFDEVLADLAGLIQVVEERRLQAGLLAELFAGGFRAVQRAHAGIGNRRDGLGGGSHLGLVVGHAALDDLRLDLAHVPGHERITGLAEFDLLFRLELCLAGQADQQHGGAQAAHRQCFHDISFIDRGPTVARRHGVARVRVFHEERAAPPGP